MSLAPSRSTQPMSVPWVNARRGQPACMMVTLERRVSLVVEDGFAPVAELHARVFAMELVALLTIARADGSILEQRRVRASASDAARFAATVLEQTELACHLCPGLTIAICHDDDVLWQALRVGLSALAVDGERVEVLDTVERAPMTSDDLELTRRARRRPLGGPPSSFAR